VLLQETNLDTEATLDGVPQMMDLSPENDKKWMVFFQQRWLLRSQHFHDILNDLFDMSKAMLIYLHWFVHNINLFFLVSLHTMLLDIVWVKQFLQDVDLNVFVDWTNAQDDLDTAEVVVSIEIPLNMLVIVRLGIGTLTNETFWLELLKCLTVGDTSWDTSNMTEKRGMTCFHEAILLLGVY
jgi:hypothetical protein